jgi:C4-dicarboxylate transporter DctM subunit
MGLPIALAMILGGMIPITVLGIPLNIVAQRIYASVDVFTLLSIPLFILAGGLMDKGGVSKRLISFADSLVGWLPGGLAVVTFFASAFFGAISGSSSATVAAIGAVMIPGMIKANYPRKFALATVASAGYLGVVVPPSIPMILYGASIGGVNVGNVFMGGLIPGFMLAGSMSVYAIIYGRKNLPPSSTFILKNVGKSFIGAIGALGMPIVILGGIYSGAFTPTEAAAVAVLYGFIISLFVYRELSFKDMLPVLKNACVTTGVVMLIISAASLFGWIMTLENITSDTAKFILSLAQTKFSFFLVVTIFLLFVGTFMDTAPAVMVTAVLLAPIAKTFGIDLVFFGVYLVITLAIGMVTPPVGLNLYVTATVAKTTANEVINKHLFMYLLFAIIVVILFMVFPQIVMFLPNMMIRS